MSRSTSGRRLDRLEQELSPRQLVRLWLEERAAFASAADYAAWLADQPLGEAHLDRIPGRADTTVHQADSEVAYGGLAKARRDALFGVQLALVLEVTLAATARTEGLVSARLYWQLRALTAEWSDWPERGPDEEPIGTVASWAAWRDAFTEHYLALHIDDEARSRLERRYLDGHGAVFLDTLAQLDRLQRLAASMASWWAELPGPPIEGRSVHGDGSGSGGVDLEAIRALARSHASARADELVDAAHVATLELLDDARGALAHLAARRTDEPDRVAGAGDEGARR